MPIIRNKAEKVNMVSYLEAATERFEVVIFKAASQLDLASLRDYKKYAALRILKWTRCILQQILSNLCFSAFVFLNFAKGMICNCYKGFAAVVYLCRPLRPLEKTSYGLKVLQQYARKKIILVSYHSRSKRCPESQCLSTQKKEKRSSYSLSSAQRL